MATVFQDATKAARQVGDQVGQLIDEHFDPDYYTTDEYSDDDEYDLSAQQQWEELIEQITNLFSMVLFPLLGKVLGRRSAHMIWGRVANWWFV